MSLAINLARVKTAMTVRGIDYTLDRRFWELQLHYQPVNDTHNIGVTGGGTDSREVISELRKGLADKLSSISAAFAKCLPASESCPRAPGNTPRVRSVECKRRQR
ncbi:hypothetical protein CSUI_001652 [Cystoisospora suis]|uniref:Uncharacterized protein n=1 Tax=Cystoisospora suis TaxID=483139 RepID=A0A2C6KWN2_9APIC|nr:hypothetical protein CSUI_001652 [Cystoisospora suis]